MMKRLLDILISLIALLLLAIPFLIIIVVLKCTGEHNVWYLQERVGQGGRIFRVFKFVTMRVGSEFTGSKDITVRHDPRVLPVGKILRMTKLNELPQFINVFLGDMSVVGWRPLVPRGFDDYPEFVKENIVKVKPGVTGLGSIVFRDEEAIVTEGTRQGKELRAVYQDDIMPYKGRLELWYAEHQSLWLDLKIIVATALAVLLPGSTFYRRWFHGLPEPESELVRTLVLGTGETISDNDPSGGTSDNPPATAATSPTESCD